MHKTNYMQRIKKNSVGSITRICPEAAIGMLK